MSPWLSPQLAAGHASRIAVKHERLSGVREAFSATTTTDCPASAALCAGVKPVCITTVASAPILMSILTASECPLAAARCSGVLLSVSVTGGEGVDRPSAKGLVAHVGVASALNGEHDQLACALLSSLVEVTHVVVVGGGWHVLR
jgi:hypothetical protein